MPPSVNSGGSSISHRGAMDSLRGMDLRRGHFSVKMHVKMRELGPVGERAPGKPPRSANASVLEARSAGMKAEELRLQMYHHQ